MLTQKIFKAARIKDGPAPKDAAPRKAGQLLRDMGQDINGIGHDKENALIIAFGNLRNDRAKMAAFFLPDQGAFRPPSGWRPP